MNIKDLLCCILSPQEKEELKISVDFMENNRYKEFFEKNKEIILHILLVKNLDEFLVFLSEDNLDMEYFCFAFLCAKQYGFQVAGYEEDLRPFIISFFSDKRPELKKSLPVIEKNKISYDKDNFAEPIKFFNQKLNTQHLRLIMFKDCIYSRYEYTVLLVPEELYYHLLTAWTSDNFELIY